MDCKNNRVLPKLFGPVFILLSFFIFYSPNSFSNSIDLETESCLKNGCEQGKSCFEFLNMETMEKCPSTLKPLGEYCDPFAPTSECCSGSCGTVNGLTENVCKFPVDSNNNPKPNVECSLCTGSGQQSSSSKPCCEGLSPDQRLICQPVGNRCDPFVPNSCTNNRETCLPDKSFALVPGLSPGSVCIESSQCSTQNCVVSDVDPSGNPIKRCIQPYKCQSCASENEAYDEANGISCCSGYKKAFGVCVKDLPPLDTEGPLSLTYKINDLCGVEWNNPALALGLNLGQYWMNAMEYTFMADYQDMKGDERYNGDKLSWSDNQFENSFFGFNRNFFEIAHKHFILRYPIDTIFQARTKFLEKQVKAYQDSSDANLQRLYSDIISEMFLHQADRSMSLSYLYEFIQPLFGPAIEEISDHYWGTNQTGGEGITAGLFDTCQSYTVNSRSDAGDYRYQRARSYNICSNPAVHVSDRICIVYCVTDVDGDYRTIKDLTSLLMTGEQAYDPSTDYGITDGSRRASRLVDPVYPNFGSNHEPVIGWATGGSDGDDTCNGNYKGYLKEKLQGTALDPIKRLPELKKTLNAFTYPNVATADYPACEIEKYRTAGNVASEAFNAEKHIPVVITEKLKYLFTTDASGNTVPVTKSGKKTPTNANDFTICSPDATPAVGSFCIDSGRARPCYTYVKPFLKHEDGVLKGFSYRPSFSSEGIYISGTRTSDGDKDKVKKYELGSQSAASLRPYLEAAYKQWAFLNNVRFSKLPDQSGKVYLDDDMGTAGTIAYEFFLHAFDQRSDSWGDGGYENECHYDEEAEAQKDLLLKLSQLAGYLRSFYRQSAFAFRDAAQCFKYKSNKEYGDAVTSGGSTGDTTTTTTNTGSSTSSGMSSYSSGKINSIGTTLDGGSNQNGATGSGATTGGSTSLSSGGSTLLNGNSGTSGFGQLPTFTPGQSSSGLATSSLGGNTAFNKAFTNRLKEERKDYVAANKNNPFLKASDKVMKSMLDFKPKNAPLKNQLLSKGTATSAPTPLTAANLTTQLEEANKPAEVTQAGEKAIKTNSSQYAQSSNNNRSFRTRGNQYGGSNERVRSTESSAGIGRAANSADVNRNADESLFDMVKRAYLKTVDRLFK